MIDSLMNHLWSFPHISPNDLHVFDKDELLEDSESNMIKVGDTVKMKDGVKFTIDAFLDVVAVGTYAISEECGLYALTSEVIRVKKIDINKIYHGDCLDVMKDIPDGSVDMILCDLPYGTTARNKWDEIIPFNRLWEQYNRIIKENGAIVLTAQTPFDKMLGCSNLKMLRYEWIWEKTSATGHLNAKRMPMKAHENILVFYKKLPTYNPQKTFGHERKVSTAKHKRNSVQTLNYNEHGLTSYDSTERYPRSVQIFATDKQKEALHSTQKPVALFEYLIKTYTNEGETVLDNAIGSGTTAIAAINTNRKYIGIDIEQEFVNMSNKRISEHLTKTQT